MATLTARGLGPKMAFHGRSDRERMPGNQVRSWSIQRVPAGKRVHYIIHLCGWTSWRKRMVAWHDGVWFYKHTLSKWSIELALPMEARMHCPMQQQMLQGSRLSQEKGGGVWWFKGEGGRSVMVQVWWNCVELYWWSLSYVYHNSKCIIFYQ